MDCKILKNGIIVRAKKIFGYNGWPTIARLPKGELAVVFSGNRLYHVDPFGKIMICYSYDEGKTWTKPCEVIDTPLDNRDGGICVAGDGKVMVTGATNCIHFQRSAAMGNDKEQKRSELILAYCSLLTQEDEKKYLGSLYSLSCDGGRTFGEIMHLPIFTPHGPCRLLDGQVLLVGTPFSSPDISVDGDGNYITLPVVYNPDYPKLEDRIYQMRSRDCIVWSKPQKIVLPEELLALNASFSEPYAIQLKSGKILLHLRCDAEIQSAETGIGKKFCIYQLSSDDGGKTFGNLKQVTAHGAPSHLMQHSSGAIICSYGYRTQPLGVRAAVSLDDGETWEETVLRDDAPSEHGEGRARADLGYASSVELKDGSMLTVYYQTVKGDLNPSIQYTRWSF